MRITIILCILISLTATISLAQECVDYGDFMHWVGKLDYPVYNQTVVGNTAYMAAGDSGIVIMDLSDPESPQVIGRLGGNAQEIVVQGNRLIYSDNYPHLHIADIADPSNPQLLGTMYAVAPIRQMAVHGDLVFAAQGNIYLRVIDISDPTAPFFSHLFGYGRVSGGICIEGDLAAMQFQTGGLSLVDISDPYDLREIGNIPGFSGIRHMTMEDGKLYISGGHWFVIYDVSDASNPVRVGTLHSEHVHYDFFLEDDLVFISVGSDGVDVLDISDPSAPTPISQIDLVGSGHHRGLAMVADHLFVPLEESGYHIVDISNPLNPPAFNQLETLWEVRLFPYDDYVMAMPLSDWGRNLQVIDIQDPDDPRLIQTVDFQEGIKDFEYSGNVGIVATSFYGLHEIHVIDLAQPSRPRLMETIEVPIAFGDIEIDGNLVFRILRGGILEIIDLQGLTGESMVVGRLQFPEGVHEIFPNGTLVYARGPNPGFHVLDISNPTDPQIVGFVETQEQMHIRVTHGSFMLATDHANNLLIFDISQPAEPELAGSFAFPEIFLGGDARISITGDAVYVTDSRNVLVIDISNLPFLELITATYLPLNIRSYPVSNGEMLIAGLDESGILFMPLHCEGSLGVDEGNDDSGPTIPLPKPYLLRAHPNPFNPGTAIAFSLERVEQVKLDVFDLSGKKVATLLDHHLDAGSHSISWQGLDDSGRAMPTGSYLVRLETEARVASQKITLIK